MRRQKVLRPEFVQSIPTGSRKPGEIVVSCRYNVASFLCPCGCGAAMDIIFRPYRWRMEWDGEHLSICPSISSPRLACKSHYWITRNEVILGT